MKNIYSIIILIILLCQVAYGQKGKNGYTFYKQRNDKKVLLNSGAYIHVNLNKEIDNIDDTISTHNYRGYIVSLNDSSLTIKCTEENITRRNSIKSSYDNFHYKYPTRKEVRRFNTVIGTAEDTIFGVIKVIKCSNIALISYEPKMTSVYGFIGCIAFTTIFEIAPLVCLNYSNWKFNSSLYWTIAGYAAIPGIPAFVLGVSSTQYLVVTPHKE